MKRFGHFEGRFQPLLSRGEFTRRLAAHGGAALLVVLFALAIGMLGYHATERMSWIDSFVNASMILSGMGPVGELRTNAGKAFAGCYALFSGFVFLFAVSLMLAPVAHRVLHRFHLEESEEEPE